MVAYIIIAALASMFVFGMVYSIVSDERDMIVPLYSQLSVQAGYLNDSESQGGLDFLNFLLSFSAAFFVFGLVWWMHQHAQKPEQPF